jgi:hypothetical protein
VSDLHAGSDSSCELERLFAEDGNDLLLNEQGKSEQQEADGQTDSDKGKTVTAREICKTYSEKQKRRIVEYAQHHRVRPAQRQYKVPRKNIQRWLSELKKMQCDAVKVTQGRQTRRHKKGQGRKLSYPKEVDDKLLEWVLKQRELHLPVTTTMLLSHAKLEIALHNPAFKASVGWSRKFIRRHNLSLRARTSVAQQLPSDLEDKLLEFTDYVQDIQSGHNFLLRLVRTMDETPLYFDMVPNRSLDLKGVRTVRVRTTGADKRHITVVLTSSASGVMIPPLVIFEQAL